MWGRLLKFCEDQELTRLLAYKWPEWLTGACVYIIWAFFYRRAADYFRFSFNNRRICKRPTRCPVPPRSAMLLLINLCLSRDCQMLNALSELKEKASQLSEAERAEFAPSLLESLDGPSDPGV